MASAPHDKFVWDEMFLNRWQKGEMRCSRVCKSVIMIGRHLWHPGQAFIQIIETGTVQNATHVTFFRFASISQSQVLFYFFQRCSNAMAQPTQYLSERLTDVFVSVDNWEKGHLHILQNASSKKRFPVTQVVASFDLSGTNVKLQKES